MPIQDKALKKTFVSVPYTATVAQAVAALKQAGGQGWWTLLVTHSDGHIGATTFTELAKLVVKFGPALFARGWPICPCRSRRGPPSRPAAWT